ncbi:DUF4342 domain-containing protein [Candidatus Fermentibacterales bacterium]|nr:DUF4342 domain-containing protein [Candidatus Fermentibacterales bacterium]
MTEEKNERIRTEEFRVSGADLVDKVKEVVRKGNIRRVVIKSEEGRALIDIPLTVGVAGAIIAPQLAAVSAIAALVMRCSVMIERVEKPDQTAGENPAE